MNVPELKNRLILIGGSHMFLIAKHLRDSVPQNSFPFNIYEITKTGYTLARLIKEKYLQISDITLLTDKDVIIVHGFGNSLFHKKNVLVTKERNQKIFHITNPETKNVLPEIQLAKEFFRKTQAKVYFIDNWPRHLLCCPHHPWTKTIPDQKRLNTQIHTLLGGEFSVLTHKQALRLNRAQTRNFYLVAKKTRDRVHLTSTAYRQFALFLLDQLSGSSAPH